MFLVVARAPPPDVPYWPGRRWFAAIDALAWPASWVMVIAKVPAPVGLFGAVAITWAVFTALSRLQRALWSNHRYRFTTWRWGRLGLALIVFGGVMKLALLWRT